MRSVLARFIRGWRSSGNIALRESQHPYRIGSAYLTSQPKEHILGYDNTNSGALFPNDRKRGDTDRDHNGKVEVTCPHCNKSGLHWISAWDNTSRAGKQYMAVKFQPVEDDRPSGGSQPGNRGQNPDGTTRPPPRDIPDGVDPNDIEPDDIPF